jgi:hypothetical protein
MQRVSYLLTSAALAGLLAGTTGPAAAERYEIGFTSGARHMVSASVDALTADDTHPVLAASAALDLTPIRIAGFALEVSGTYERLALSGTTFQRVESDLSVHSLRVGGRLRRALSPRWSAFGSLDMGWTTGSLRLHDAFSGNARPTHDRAHAASSVLGGGVDLSLMRHASQPRFSFGLRGQLDYTVSSALAFSGAPEAGAPGELNIPTLSAPLGDIDLSGWSFRLGLFGRF